jgi:hypothetical protein
MAFAFHCRFAKRFAHPDVVSVFELIFIWDEDIGIDTFDPMRCVLHLLSVSPRQFG